MAVSPQGLGGGPSTEAIDNSVAVSSTGVIFTTHPTGTDAVIVAVHGDIDMRSAASLQEYVVSRVGEGTHVVLDLTGVDFFAIAGLRVLAATDLVANNAGTSWSIVESTPVTRLLETAPITLTARRYLRLADALINTP